MQAELLWQDSGVARAEIVLDPAQAPDTRHFLYLPTSKSADAIARTLEREGWDTTVLEDDDVWLVVAGYLRVVTEPLVRETRERLAALAAAHGGVYDGWEPEQA
jgi:Regulator of ribonuclease activity B